MSKPASSVIRITAAQDSTALSKGQKTFNRLIKKIEDQRKLLQMWQDTLPRFQARRTAEYAPLVGQYNEQRVKLVHLLDQASSAKGLTKTEHAKLSDLIASIIGELLASNGSPELIALYDKHNDISFTEEEQMAAEAAKAMAQNLFGVDLGDTTDLGSPDDVAALLEKKMLEKHEAQQNAQGQQRSQRKPTAKALAREAKRQEEERSASQSIREVFRKLASALHPDRETDAQERTRKTALMQRVNAAYERSDLLALLQLQLEVEQIDSADIGALSETRLKHFNKVLTEQLAELEEELFHIEAQFDDGDPFSQRRPHPALILQWLDLDIAQLNEAMADIERDLQKLGDIKYLKATLKRYRIQPDDFFDLRGF